MPQDFVIMLLRQINSSLPADNRMLPKRISALTLSQIYLLDELYAMSENECGIVSLSSLARESGFSKSTVCTTLKCLRKSGYIKMQMDNEDNRRKEIVLTEQARAVEPDVKQYVNEFNHALCAGIPEEEFENLEKALRTVLQNARSFRARSL